MMKKPFMKLLLAALLSTAMVCAFSACGSGDGDGNGTTAPTEVVSDYDTVVYTYEDNETPEDLYSSRVTIEYDGDKVMGVTVVTIDDMTAEDDEDIFQMHLNDYDGLLDDTGFKEMDGFTWNVDVSGKVRTETVHYDLTKFDVNTYKKAVGIENENDYVSLEDLTKIYEDAGFVKEEAAEETEEAE